MKTTLLFLSVFLSVSLFSQNVYIPDASFKALLVGNPDINTNGDTEIQVSEASSYDGLIFTSSINISDLTGIEAFTALTLLNCSGNQITSLDLSQNTNLTELSCSGNQLTSLDVSQNTSLTKLYCEDNQLTSLNLNGANSLLVLVCANNSLTTLDVSQNIALTQLVCSVNQITSLNLNQNIGLNILGCKNNQLTCLNVANENNLNFLYFDSDINPNLTCIQVDNAAYSTTNWTLIDPQQYFSEDCGNDCTSSLTELTNSKNLIQILDMMGRETTFKPNTPLIYVYDDGSTEKVFSVEY